MCRRTVPEGEELLAVITDLPTAETAEAWREAWEMVPEGHVLQLTAVKLGNGSAVVTAAIHDYPMGGRPPLEHLGSTPAEALRGLISRANDSEGWHPDDDPGSPTFRVFPYRLWEGAGTNSWPPRQ